MPIYPNASTIWWVRGNDPRVNTQYVLGVSINSNVNNGDAVRFNGSVFEQAQASTAANADVVGFIVNKDAGTNTGDLIIANGLLAGFSGLVSGSPYYLSPSSPGGITATKPAIPVLLGFATSASTLLVTIRSEMATSRVLRGVAQSGCANGQVVRHNGTAYVPAQASTLTNAQAVGVIQNVSGGTGDVYTFGAVSSTGMIALTAGTTYYLSQTSAGALSATRPDHGLIVKIGYAETSGILQLGITPTYLQYSNDVFCPINYADKASGLPFFQLISGTGSVSYNSAATSRIGTGAYEFTGTGVWVLNTFYAVNPDVGIGAVANYAITTGSGTLSLGFRGFDASQSVIAHVATQNNFLLNAGAVSSATYTYAQAMCVKEGAAVGNFPTSTRWLQPRIEIAANPSTIRLDSFLIYPLRFATMALYS